MAQEDQNGEVISFLGDIFTHRSSITVYGVYRGPIAARSYLKPEGQGDYDGAGSDEGRAYSGLWRNGRPRGTGWWSVVAQSRGRVDLALEGGGRRPVAYDVGELACGQRRRMRPSCQPSSGHQ